MSISTAAVPEDTRSPLRRLFTSRSFVALFFSNAFGFGGEQMRLAAQSWWILEEGGSNTEMGLAAGLRIIPILIVSLYAGVMIDRLGGKRVLIAERILLVVFSLTTAFVLFSDQAQIWHIIVLSTAAGTTLAMGYPATQTLVADVTPSDLRQSANSMNQLGYAVGKTLGPLLAGILIAIRDAAVAFIGLAAVYGVALLATFGVATKRPERIQGESAIREIMNGLAYIRQTSVLMWLILMAFSVIFFSFFFPLIPAYAQDVLDANEIQFGWMWGAMAIGQGMAAVTIGAIGGFRNKALGPVVGGLIFGIGMIAFGLSETYWMSLVFLFVTGVGIPIWVTSVLTLLQNHTEPEYRGRVLAIYAVSMQGTALGWMFGGFLLDTIGNFPTVLVSIVGAWGIMVIAYASSKELRSAR